MRTMIVTGASSGIGRALALRAAEAGFALVLVARRGELLDELAREIHARGGMCTALTLDVRDADAAQAIVATALQRYGRVDIVVNNAGIAAHGTLLEQSDTQLQAQWETHVLAPLRLAREALPQLRTSGGQIFFFGSGVARVPTPSLGAYPPAKAAVRALATQMRRELRGSGVAVTYVDPGAVDTPFMQNAGMSGPPARLMVSPDIVAKKILRAVQTRPRAVSAVPWQTAMVAIGELLPALTDIVLGAAPGIVGTQKLEKRSIELALPEPTQPHDQRTQCHAERTQCHAERTQCHAERTQCHAEPVEAWNEPQSLPTTSCFDAALEPVARRMERVKLPRAFVEQLLVPGATLELGEVSMRWAGMPNKNERAAVAEVFDALTNAQYLQKSGEETWTVVRSSTSR